MTEQQLYSLCHRVHNTWVFAVPLCAMDHVTWGKSVRSVNLTSTYRRMYEERDVNLPAYILHA
jgi:hypothetical protein